MRFLARLSHVKVHNHKYAENKRARNDGDGYGCEMIENSLECSSVISSPGGAACMNKN